MVVLGGLPIPVCRRHIIKSIIVEHFSTRSSIGQCGEYSPGWCLDMAEEQLVVDWREKEEERGVAFVWKVD